MPEDNLFEDAVAFAALKHAGQHRKGTKLSNIRSIQCEFEELGDEVWQRFNQKDPAEHAWYYATIADVLQVDLGHTEAWREYRERAGKVFEECLKK